MSREIIDADGHVTELFEQIARHLEMPYLSYPTSLKERVDREDVTDAQKQLIFSANPRRFYRL